ncbi:MAG: APC family permease [Candidatus Devosia symbiotica]|nr:APC family permease [Candidatus Devosia symbiotica]
MIKNLLVIVVSLLVSGVLIYPRLANASFSRATITPLASIIGSGFLVLGLILSSAYDIWAPLAMAALCAGVYLFGAAIWHNITAIERDGEARPTLERRLEGLASWTLDFAYFISVAYYLNLFGAFGVRMIPFNDTLYAKILISALFLLILAMGWLRGFKALERIEQVSVGLKLAIIAGLLFGLGRYFFVQVTAGSLEIHPATLSGWSAVTLGFGLIVAVQGFETSNYLSEAYDARTRRRSMVLAQVIATAIYVFYIGLLTYVITPVDIAGDETSIIDMMEVAPVLPLLLVAAALAAQFSAAIADTSGSGGLIAELTRGRMSERGGLSAAGAERAGVDLDARRIRNHRLCLACFCAVLRRSECHRRAGDLATKGRPMEGGLVCRAGIAWRDDRAVLEPRSSSPDPALAVQSVLPHQPAIER